MPDGRSQLDLLLFGGVSDQYVGLVATTELKEEKGEKQ
jgi:hypothetical protein